MTRQRVDLRPLAEDELPLLVGWLHQPHVQQWWRDPDDPVLRYTPCFTGEDRTRLHAITLDGDPIGMLQTYLFADEPDWSATIQPITDTTGAAGLDYLIGEPALTGQSIGTRAIDLAATRLQTKVIVDVSVGNVASWRACEKAGFTIVWTGELDSDDPSDTGPQHVLVRPAPPGTPPSR